VLRLPIFTDYFSATETDSLSTVIERHFMRRILEGDARAGSQINELELAREIGVGTTSVREFLIRFSRFGLIEKRPNSHWILKGFDEQFALELVDVREMFEVRSALAFAALPDDHPSWPALERIEAEHTELGRSMDSRYQAFSELDERFHRLIHHASGTRFVIDFYDVIAMIFHYHYQWNKSSERERNAVALVEHLDYIAALRTRSAPAVEAACRAHLRSARTTLLQSMRR
jgi:DNA-binding GntR family transcriptional regulator